MAAIGFAGVTKRFDDVVAVDDVTLDIDDGDFVVLLGPSGCGKSTVLRLIAGLEIPDEGTITIGDDVVNDLEPKDRDVAMVFQSYALYPHMTVRRNIGFSLKPLGIDRRERDRRAAEAARLLGLTDLLDRKPGQLSGGQQQRVALARAIVREPRAFLMDEPLSNLDAKLRAETRAELVSLHRRLGTTFVFVTHDQTEAMTMADRIAVMVDGRLQQVGSPAEIYDEPANIFVARFMGSPPMNTWEAVIAADSVALLGDETSLHAGQAGAGLAPGTKVWVGVRPEDISVRCPDPGAGIAAVDVGERSAVPALVTAVESMGHEQLISCELRAGGSAVARIAGRTSSPQPGEPIELLVTPDSVTLFDRDTGERHR